MTRNILDRMKASEMVERVKEKINQGVKVRRKKCTKREGAAPVGNPERAGSPQKLFLEPRERAKGRGWTVHFPEAALHCARSKGIFKTKSRSEPAKCFDLRETPWIKKQSSSVGKKGPGKRKKV